MRQLAGVIAGVLVAILAAGPARAADFSPAPWLQDLVQLRDAMSTRYANLEWQAARGLDLPGTYARAEGRLARARDEFQARRAIDRFLETFGDGHVEIAWPTPAAPPAAKLGPSPLCDRLGYADADDDGAVATRLAGFRPVGAPGGVLRAGLVEAGGKRVGVLRLPIFSPQGFRAICDRVAAQQSLTPGSTCDAACEDRFSRRADGLFVGGMQAAIGALKAAGAEVLLVDIAGNGGGDDSAILLARLLTARPMPTPRVGFLRTPAWVAELASRRAEIRAGLGTTTGAEHHVLQRYDAALTAAAADAVRTCDLSPLWRGQPSGCSAVVTGVLFAGGLSPNLPPPPRDRPWSETISAESRFPAVGPVWRGPVIVLVDGDSASSSEMFAAMMQDRRAAVILGAPTFGAGCGHMTGRDPVVLRNSGARVSLPDCVRLRADGSNEVAGVEPDVLIGFKTHDTPADRTTRLARTLPLAIARAIGRR